MANLTVVVDDEVLKRARKRAIDLGTSVSAFVAREMERFAQPETTDTPLKDLVELSKRVHGDSGGWKWNRQESYEERLGRWSRNPKGGGSDNGEPDDRGGR